MGRQSRAKKERRLARMNGEKKVENDFRILDNAPIIPSDVLIAYLMTKFIGKAGYKYISIGRHGSLFMNDQSTSIVAITLHREYPIMSVRGRFNDPERRDISVNAIHVPSGYPGMVLSRQGETFIGGSSKPATMEELKEVTIDGQKVTKEEYDAALKLEQPIIEAQLKELHDRVEADAKKAVQQIDEAEKKMNEDPYGNDVTPYTDDIVIPEVEEAVGSAPIDPSSTIQDAEIIQ